MASQPDTDELRMKAGDGPVDTFVNLVHEQAIRAVEAKKYGHWRQVRAAYREIRRINQAYLDFAGILHVDCYTGNVRFIEDESI